MTTSKPLRLLVTLTTSLSLILPASAFGDEALPNSPVVRPASPVQAPLDVSVSAAGQLMGTVVDENGEALTEITVYLLQDDGLVMAHGKSDASGKFVFEVSRGGVYQIVADGKAMLLRCWAHDTAPPAAREQVLISVGPLERGQIHPAVCNFSNAWVITGLVVAAIVIPIAIHNNRSDRPNSSN